MAPCMRDNDDCDSPPPLNWHSGLDVSACQGYRMEVDCPPGPLVVVPSNAPPLGGIRGGARVCTEPGCGALIEYDSAVGSRCDRCTIRRKARDFCAMRGGALNGVGMPPGNGVPVRRPSKNTASVSGPHQGASPSHPSRPFMLLPHQFQRPSHPPIPHSIGGVGPYANHFNSRGEMVQLARPSASMVPPLPTSAPIRLCKTPGCNAVLLPQYHYPGRRCKRCQQAQLQFVPPPAPVLSQMQRPPPPAPPPSKSTVEDLAIDLTNLDAGLDDDDVEMDDDLELELTYPELPPPPLPPPPSATPSPLVTPPLVTKTNPSVPRPPRPPSTANPSPLVNTSVATEKNPSVSPRTPRSLPIPRSPTNHRKRRKFNGGTRAVAVDRGGRSESRQPKIEVPVKKTSLKLCASPDCTGVVSPDSRAKRCVGCVMRAWKKLRLTLAVVEDDGDGNEEKGKTQREERAETGREVEKQVEKYNEKERKKKGVTWADEAKGGCLEKTRVVSLEGPPPLLLVPGRHRKMCGEMLGWEVGDKERVKVECVGLDRDEDVIMGDVKDVADEASEDVMPSNASEGSPNHLPPSFSPPPSTSPPPPSISPPPHSSSSSPTPSPVEVEVEASHHSTIRDGDDLDLRTDTDVRIPGWDSDLSNLSESDSSASETDSTTDSDSSDEFDSDTTGTSASRVPVTVTQPPQPNKTGLKIRIRIPPARPATTIRLCVSGDCSEVLEVGDGYEYKWKACVLCRARKRARRRLRGLVVELEEELRCVRRCEKKGGAGGVEIEAAALDYLQHSSEEDPIRIVPGAQLCSVRDCTHIIPPPLEYRWKVCTRCRLRGEKRRSDVVVVDPPSLNDIPLVRARHKGRCQSRDCGMFLAVHSKLVECKQCLARRLRYSGGTSTKRGRPPKSGPSNSGIVDVLGRMLARRKEYPPEKPRIPSPYIEYRSLSSLLEDFRIRLGGFLQAHSYHFMCNNASKNGVEPQLPQAALFEFDGEFSVVALDLDVPGRKADVEGEVLRLKGEVERLGRIQFSPKRMVSIFDFGIITRFVCMREVAMPISKPVDVQPEPGGGGGEEPTPTPSPAACSKTMQGELEISVLADKSHRFIPGQRTILRFRLVG